ncbi:MAG: YbjN domain-containing protein [Candidatus Eremiobacteraeota bacterium]|nr:YbjN domain-containing protein [Candidatus Eremiobacteraeota bacterium]
MRCDRRRGASGKFLGYRRTPAQLGIRRRRAHGRSQRKQSGRRQVHSPVHERRSALNEADHLLPLEGAIDDEGLLYTRDDDDEALRITFKSEGDRYFVVGYRDDPNFVMIGSGWALPPEVEMDDAFVAANALNVRKKFVKTAVWEEERDALFTVELCVGDAAEIRPHFGRLLDALRDTAVEFFSELHGGQEG